MKVKIYRDKHNSHEMKVERVSTIPENCVKPSVLMMWGGDSDEYHNIDAMGFDYDVEGDCIIISLERKATVTTNKDNK